MYLAKWWHSITSSGLTRNAHSLTLLPMSSRIFGLLQASITIGTASSLTTGRAPRQAPLCVWPMITSTLSTSTSLRTALTASPGVPALSPKESSILRPMMPPLALYSSASICAAHFTPSPVTAEGPVMAEENPTLMGGPPCACTPGRSPPSHSSSPTPIPIVPRRISVIALSSLGFSAEDRQLLARLGEPADAAGGDLDRVLDLDTAPAMFVVRRLHAEDHAGLQRGVGRRVDGGRIVGLEPDAVPHVVPLVVRHTVLARHPHRGLEDMTDLDPGLHGRDGGLLAVAGGVVVAELLLARRPEHGGPRDVRA